MARVSQAARRTVLRVSRGAIRPLVVARAIRGFADGFVSVLLARYLVELGFSGLQGGVLVTATLVGSAVLTLIAGLRFSRFGARSVLLWSCGLMAATGLGFGTMTWFWPLMVVGVVGTLNPSGGDVSLFLPTEQAALADMTEQPARTHRFAVYNLVGGMGVAAGALAAALPDKIASWTDVHKATAERVGFIVYVACALAAALAYRRLPRVEPRVPTNGERPPPLGESRRIVIRLSALFSLDAAGGGLVVQSLLVIYLSQRFDFDS